MLGFFKLKQKLILGIYIFFFFNYQIFKNNELTLFLVQEKLLNETPYYYSLY